MTDAEWREVRDKLLEKLLTASHVLDAGTPGLYLDLDDEYDVLVGEDGLRITIVRGDGFIVEMVQRLR